MSSVKNADSIIVLDKGKLVQKGTHKELKNKEGYYKDIYMQQMSEM